MKRDLNSLTEKEFDLLVIGGGINGAGIARDAALRGLNVALVEKNDFCSGTSSKSSRLIHGGLRYLEQLEFKLVKESLKEKAILKKIAPGLVQDVDFLIPVYDKNFTKIKLGVFLYDFLSAEKKYLSLNPKETLELEPNLKKENLKGSVRYSDCKVKAERLCLENILSASKNGACVNNYTEVIDILKNKKEVFGAIVKDKISNESGIVQAKIIINASGPWADDLLKLSKRDYKKKLVRPTKGVHMITKKITNNAVVFFTEDKRVIFSIPWEDFSLIGTTDTDFNDDLENIKATDEEIKYLFEEVKKNLSVNLEWNDIISTYAGVRPLAFNKGKESDISRKYVTYDHSEDGIDNFISIVGGKLTTYRNLSEKVVDLVCKKLKIKEKCSTKEDPLYESYCDLDVLFNHLSLNYSLEKKQVKNLFLNYGPKTIKILKIASKENLKEKIFDNSYDIMAQIPYSIENEFCFKARDFIFRRTDLWMHNLDLKTIEKIVDEFSWHLNWDCKKIENEISEYFEELEARKKFLYRESFR